MPASISDASSIAPSYTSNVTLESLPSISNPTSKPAPSYSDDTIISVTLSAADLEDSGDEVTTNTNGNGSLQPQQPQPRRKSFLDKFKPSKSKGPDRIVMMTRGDYLRYWARDKNGNYIGTEPEGAGRRLLRQRHVAKQTPGQFDMPGQVEQETRGVNVPLNQHHGEGDTIVGEGARKSQRVEDRFAMVEGTMPQPLGYGNYIPQGIGFGKANRQKRMLEGMDLQRK